MGNPAEDNAASLLTVSKDYISGKSGKTGVKELQKAQRTYAPELIKEIRKAPLHSFIEEVKTKLKGNS